MAAGRTRLLRLLLDMEREAVEDYVESVMSGGDPTAIEELLRAANELASLRSNFSSGIAEDALTSQA